MSQSKFKVQKGLAYVITTGEPVYVKSFSAEGNQTAANVVRAIVGHNGIYHEHESFPVEQLETRFSQGKRNADYEKFLVPLKVEIEQLVQSEREGAEAKRFALPDHIRQALQNVKYQAANPSYVEEGING